MNYFNGLSPQLQAAQLGKCRFMGREEFVGDGADGGADGMGRLRGKKVVIVGCGAQGLSQGLNMRDSGVDVSYALRESAIREKRASWRDADGNGFTIGTCEQLIPQADVVMNLTPDKQHRAVVEQLQPLMKPGAVLDYCHGFNIVEEGMQLRRDITVILVAPKGAGPEVRAEYLRGSGVPVLVAVHPENDPNSDGLEIAKACAVALGGLRAGILESSFIAEVKSDLLGEQTILCGMLLSGSLLCYDKMVAKAIAPGYAAKLVQHGWEAITAGLKDGGISSMMNRLSDPAKLKAFELAEELKDIMRPLFQKHMDDIMSGAFSEGMMQDWADGDKKLLQWRAATASTAFEKVPVSDALNLPDAKADVPAAKATEQEYYNKCLLMIAMVKAGTELAFETMTAAGIAAESAYYESLFEVPLIARLIKRKRLHEMCKVISDTAEYGCYLFVNECMPLLQGFMAKVDTDVIGTGLSATKSAATNADQARLNAVNESIHAHPVEQIGRQLRKQTAAMQQPMRNAT